MSNPTCNSIGRLHHIFMRALDARMIATVGKETTVMQARTIIFLARHEQVFQRDIEQEFGLSRSAVSLLLDNMQKHDLIIRQTVADDARLKQIVLTPHACDLKLRIMETMQQFERDLTQNVTQQELETVVSVLQKMRDNVQ